YWETPQPCVFIFISVSVAAPSEYPEQKQEQVYKIEVKPQSADDRSFSLILRSGKSGIGHFLYFLSVVGGQADKNGYTRIGYEPVESRAAEEEINERGNYYADETHHEETANGSQVALGCVSIKAHSGEGSAGYEVCTRTGRFCVSMGH